LTYFLLDPEVDLGADDRLELDPLDLDPPELDRPVLDELRPDEPEGARPTEERLGDDDFERPAEEVGLRVDGFGAEVDERRDVDGAVRGTITGRETPVELRVDDVDGVDGDRCTEPPVVVPRVVGTDRVVGERPELPLVAPVPLPPCRVREATFETGGLVLGTNGFGEAESC
jgi:hypothetical protein